MCGKLDTLEGGFVEITGGGALQGIKCNACGATWDDLYKLDSVINLNLSDYEKPEEEGK